MAGDGDHASGLVASVDDSRNLLKREGRESARSEGGEVRPDPSTGGSRMAGSKGSVERDVGRHMIVAYVAGVVTGLALFGAGSFYYNALFH